MVKLNPKTGFRMSEREIHALLKSQGHGILSMGIDSRGYGVPVSYAYDTDKNRVILEFVNAPGSKKQHFAENTAEATLTVYKYESSDRWKSVIVTGSLEHLSDTEVVDTLASLFFSQGADAVGEMRWIELDELERVWYEIQISEITGRYSGVHSTGTERR